MKIELRRKVRNKFATLGQLYVDGVFECFTLEDTDRDLRQGMSQAETYSKKIKGRTAIGTGTYRVVVTYSPRFKRDLPGLVGVAGFAGIRIHPGNTAADTEGCILPGLTWDTKGNTIGQSVKAFTPLFGKIKEAISKADRVLITITQDY